MSHSWWTADEWFRDGARPRAAAQHLPPVLQVRHNGQQGLLWGRVLREGATSRVGLVSSLGSSRGFQRHLPVPDLGVSTIYPSPTTCEDKYVH